MEKLLLPLFDGFNNDPELWLETMEEYFEYSQISMDRYVKVAINHLRGLAADWAEKNKLVISANWCAFSYNLLWEFDPSTKIPEVDELTTVKKDEVVVSKEWSSTASPDSSLVLVSMEANEKKISVEEEFECVQQETLLLYDTSELEEEERSRVKVDLSLNSSHVEDVADVGISILTVANEESSLSGKKLSFPMQAQQVFDEIPDRKVSEFSLSFCNGEAIKGPDFLYHLSDLVRFYKYVVIKWGKCNEIGVYAKLASIESSATLHTALTVGQYVKARQSVVKTFECSYLKNDSSEYIVVEISLLPCRRWQYPFAIQYTLGSQEGSKRGISTGTEVYACSLELQPQEEMVLQVITVLHPISSYHHSDEYVSDGELFGRRVSTKDWQVHPYRGTEGELSGTPWVLVRGAVCESEIVFSIAALKSFAFWSSIGGIMVCIVAGMEVCSMEYGSLCVTGDFGVLLNVAHWFRGSINNALSVPAGSVWLGFTQSTTAALWRWWRLNYIIIHTHQVLYLQGVVEEGWYHYQKVQTSVQNKHTAGQRSSYVLDFPHDIQQKYNGVSHGFDPGISKMKRMTAVGFLHLQQITNMLQGGLKIQEQSKSDFFIRVMVFLLLVLLPCTTSWGRVDIRILVLRDKGVTKVRDLLLIQITMGMNKPENRDDHHFLITIPWGGHVRKISAKTKGTGILLLIAAMLIATTSQEHSTISSHHMNSVATPYPVTMSLVRDKVYFVVEYGVVLMFNEGDSARLLQHSYNILMFSFDPGIIYSIAGVRIMKFFLQATKYHLHIQFYKGGISCVLCDSLYNYFKNIMEMMVVSRILFSQIKSYDSLLELFEGWVSTPAKIPYVKELVSETYVVLAWVSCSMQLAWEDESIMSWKRCSFCEARRVGTFSYWSSLQQKNEPVQNWVIHIILPQVTLPHYGVKVAHHLLPMTAVPYFAYGDNSIFRSDLLIVMKPTVMGSKLAPEYPFLGSVIVFYDLTVYYTSLGFSSPVMFIVQYCHWGPLLYFCVQIDQALIVFQLHVGIQTVNQISLVRRHTGNSINWDYKRALSTPMNLYGLKCEDMSFLWTNINAMSPNSKLATTTFDLSWMADSRIVGGFHFLIDPGGKALTCVSVRESSCVSIFPCVLAGHLLVRCSTRQHADTVWTYIFYLNPGISYIPLYSRLNMQICEASGVFLAEEVWILYHSLTAAPGRSDFIKKMILSTSQSDHIVLLISSTARGFEAGIPREVQICAYRILGYRCKVQTSVMFTLLDNKEFSLLDNIHWHRQESASVTLGIGRVQVLISPRLAYMILLQSTSVDTSHCNQSNFSKAGIMGVITFSDSMLENWYWLPSPTGQTCSALSH